MADRAERVFHVGRLDVDTEGLLLLTNDGELANRISHPSHGVARTYVATVEGRVDAGLRARLRRPVELDDGPVTVDHTRIVDSADDRSVVEVTLHEGRNRIVRRLFDALGHPVTRLVRTQVGPVRLGALKPGHVREVSGAISNVCTPRRACSLRMWQCERCAERPRSPQTNADPSWRPWGTDQGDAGGQPGRPGRVISVILTSTPDLISRHPATAARLAGLDDVPLLSATGGGRAGRDAASGRIMAHVESDIPRGQVEHVYLHAGLRACAKTPPMTDILIRGAGLLGPPWAWHCPRLEPARSWRTVIQVPWRRLWAWVRVPTPTAPRPRSSSWRCRRTRSHVGRCCLTRFPQATVSDVGSVKSEPIAAPLPWQRTSAVTSVGIRWLVADLRCSRGPRGDLFEDRPWILTVADTDPQRLAQVSSGAERTRSYA